jgi:hypothetical protein
MSNSNIIVKLTKSLLACAVLIQSSAVFGWGQTGHRVSGQVAESYLSEQAKKQIEKLFPNESLAEISTYADEQRSNPSKFWQKTSGPWHYVTIPSGNEYIQQKHAPREGDAYTALAAFKKTLQSKTATIEEKQLALHFTVHIIGDLHQPLHCGNGTDRGGNTVKLEFFWEDSNLHRVWDSGLIDRKQLSFTEWTAWLQQKMSPEMVAQWKEADPKVWIKESIALRNGLYPEEDKLSWQYQYDHIPTVKLRLQMAGVRVAAYLNEVFK